MKDFLKYLALIVFVCFTFVNCSKEESEAINPSDKLKYEVQDSYLLKDKVLLKKIEKLGFDVSEVWVFDEYYSVEGDIALKKEIVSNVDLNKQTASLKSLVMNFSNVNNINYYIDSSVTSIPNNFGGTQTIIKEKKRTDAPLNNWVSAIVSAVGGWNAISHSKVKFNRVFSLSSAELVFYSDTSSSLPTSHQNLPSDVWARATFPANGNIGSIISINDNPPGPTNSNGRTDIIQHELGHCLGFHHSTLGNTNITNVLCGTNMNETTSIMKPFLSGFSNFDFNENDIRAARLLYPDFGSLFPGLTVTSGNCNVRRGTKSVTIRMNNENGMDWGDLKVQTGAGGTIRTIYCVPTGNIPTILQMNPCFSNVNITFYNYKGDAQSNTINFTGL